MSELESKKTIKVSRKVERITLNDANVERIDRWIVYLGTKKKGLKITRKDLVNWLVENMPEELPTKLQKGLIESFFDEAVFLKAALKELRAAKAKGESLTLKDILAAESSPRKPKRSKLKKSQDSGSQVDN